MDDFDRCIVEICEDMGIDIEDFTDHQCQEYQKLLLEYRASIRHLHELMEK